MRGSCGRATTPADSACHPSLGGEFFQPLNRGSAMFLLPGAPRNDILLSDGGATPRKRKGNHMMRSSKKLFVFCVLVCLCVGTPVWAAAEPADMGIQINGADLDAVSMLIEDGYSMAPAEALAMATGALLQWQDESNLTLSKNGVTLALSEGSGVMRRGGGEIPLAVAPLRRNGVLHLPVRAVCDGLNLQIQWNEPGRQVEVSFDNIRDGMTPEDLMLKAQQAMQNMNVYEMSGDNVMFMDINGETVNVNTQMTASVQTAPFAIHTRQSMVMDLDSLDASVPIEAESYITESDLEYMYAKQGELGWIKMPMPMDPELFWQQIKAEADPEAAMAQMKQYGVVYAFADDAVRDGQSYYAVNVAVDRQMMKGVMDSMTAMLGDRYSDVREIMEQMDLDMSYTVLINKVTWIQESVSTNMNLRMQVEGQTVQMRMTSQTSVTPLDSFAAPDVSGALEINLETGETAVPADSEI
jgi:hypothetical protein